MPDDTDGTVYADNLDTLSTATHLMALDGGKLGNLATTALATILASSGPVAEALSQKAPLSSLQDITDRLETVEATSVSGYRVTEGGDVAASSTASDGNLALTGAYTVDGLTLSDGDRYVAQYQTDPAENGVYVYASGGAHTRASDFDAAGEFRGKAVVVAAGATNGGRILICYSEITTLGTDPVEWTLGPDVSAVQAQIDGLADVASTGDSDDLTEGAAQLLMTPGERSKLALLSLADAIDVTALSDEVDIAVAKVAGLRGAQLNRTGIKGYAFALVDGVGRVVGVLADGKAAFGGYRLNPTTFRDRGGPLGYPLVSDGEGKSPIHVMPDGAIHIGKLSAETSAALTKDGLPLKAEATRPRGGPLGTPLIADKDGRVALHVDASGALSARALSGDFIQAVRDGLQSGEDLSEIPGWNRQPLDASTVLTTIPSEFGPVEVEWPRSGNGLVWVRTDLRVEIISMSAQSNAIDGGDGDNYNFILRGIRDHRALRDASGRAFGDGDGSADPWQAGDITGFVRAGQESEIAGINQFTPDAITFSCIATDQREVRPQRAYVQMASVEGGRALTEFMAGTVKGDNIAGMISETADVLADTYGRASIMYAHCLIGHENSDSTGFADYGTMLSQFADEVCGYGAALDGNVAAGVRPKVLAYQPNSGITEAPADRKTLKESATETLRVGLSDPDVVCIGPVYHEKTVDNGIHMAGKLMTAELFAHVYDLVRAGQDFVPLHVSVATIDSNVITLTIDGPDGYLVADDDWMPMLDDYGLFYDDETSSAAIQTVQINPRSIELTLDAVPTGANPTVYIAGQNNTSDPGHPGGMASIYVPGRQSYWYRRGFHKWTTPELRFYLCRAAVAVS